MIVSGRQHKAKSQQTRSLRRQIEEQLQSLRESEERYRMLFEINPQPMYVYDRETLEFLAVNRAMIESYGWSREELLQMTVRDIRPPEDVPRMLAALAGTQAGLNLGGEWRHRKKDGSLITVEIAWHSLSFDNRSAILVQAVDVTERRRTEEKIRKLNDYLESSVRERTAQLAAANAELSREVSERRRAEETLRQTNHTLETLIQASPLAIIMFDPQGRVQVWNAAAERMFGWTETEMRGQLLPLGDEQERLEFQTLGEVVMQGVQFRVMDLRTHRRDGAAIDLSISAAPVADDAGRISGIVAVVNEITERKRAEEQLRQNEERYRAIIENMISGLVLTDERGIIQLLNPAAAKIFGYEKGELIGQHLAILLPDSIGKERVSFLKNARQKALGRVTEWEGKRRSGEVFPLELTFYEFSSPEGRRLAGNIRDLSERREVDRLKQEFISTVSHELRTPLASMRGSLRLLSSGLFGELPPEANELIAVADRNAVRLIALINDILDLERLEHGKVKLHFSAQPLAHILARARESVQALAAQQKIQLNISPVDLTVVADGDRIVQVIVNLLSNAVKFSPAGSAIQVSASEQNGWIEVRVTDQGRGIPAAYLDKVFERFRQVEASDDREKGGTGLGLAICKNIIEQHHGVIGVESVEGRGSTFWFRLPAVAP